MFPNPTNPHPICTGTSRALIFPPPPPSSYSLLYVSTHGNHLHLARIRQDRPWTNGFVPYTFLCRGLPLERIRPFDPSRICKAVRIYRKRIHPFEARILPRRTPLSWTNAYLTSCTLYRELLCTGKLSIMKGWSASDTHQVRPDEKRQRSFLGEGIGGKLAHLRTLVVCKQNGRIRR